VILGQLQFGGVLDGDDPLVIGMNELMMLRWWSCPSRCRRDDHVLVRLDAHLDELGHLGGERLVLDQIFDLQRVALELPDRDAGPLSASGGMIALTRLPSFNRASTSGLDSSIRRPIGATIRSITPSTAWLEEKILSLR